MYVLLIKNLNPFSTERKIQDQMSQGVLYMLWNECVSSEFFKRICKKDNFNYLNGKNVLHPKTIEIIWKFIEKDVESYKPLRDYFQNTNSFVNMCIEKSILIFIPPHKIEE